MAPSVEQELLRHTAALRRLARSLVGEEHADDLVQDTALVALQKPAQRPHRSGGWLAGIARHLAMHHHRRERRRRRREQRQARPEAVPPDTSLDDRDTLRLLTEAMLALPEPYGAVLLQRYLRDLTPPQIAAQRGVPVATVKSQLQRGLAMLRLRLQQRHADWRAVLCLGLGIERALPVAAGAALVTTSGWWIMGTTVKVAAAAMVLLAGGAAWWFASGGSDDARPIARATVSAPAVAGAAGDVRRAQPMPPAGHGQALRTELPAASDAPHASLHGRCVDERGMPVAGAIASVHGAALSQRAREQAGATPELDVQVSTGSDGTFALAFAPPAGFTFSLQVEAAGRARARAAWNSLAADAELDLGDVVLRPAVQVRGVVFDEDGAPVVETGVDLRRQEEKVVAVRAAEHGSATTRNDGSFVVGGPLASGSWEITVADREVAQGGAVQLAAPTADLRVVLRRLDPARCIRGLVTDETGLPLANVRVGLRRDPVPRHLTRRDGTFQLVRPEGDDDSPVSLVFSKSGCESLQTDAVAWGSGDLRLVLRAVRGQVVQVLRADDGEPVEHFTLHVLRQGNGITLGRDPGHGGEHPRGRVPLQLQSGSYRLLVVPADTALANSELVPFAVSGRDGETAIVRLEPRIERVLRLQRSDGTPVPEARAQLCLPPVDDHGLGMAPLPLAMFVGSTFEHMSLQQGGGSTDAAGELRLSGAAGVAYELDLPGPGHAPLRLHAVRLDQDGPLVVTVQAGATLRGRCTPIEALADLRALGAVTDASKRGRLSEAPAPAVQLSKVGSAQSCPARGDPPIEIAADGKFEIDHVPAGEWSLCLLLALGSDSGRTVLPQHLVPVVLRDGEVAQRDVDLSGYRTGRLEAQVLHNGAPLASAFVCPKPVVTAGSGEVARMWSTVRTDAEGRISCTRFHGPFHLEWSPTHTPFAACLRADETIEVLPGQTVTQVFHLRSGTLRARVVDANGAPAAGVKVELIDAAGEWRWTMPETDADGRTQQQVEATTFTCGVVPAALLAQDPRRAAMRGPPGEAADPLTASRLRLGSVTVQEGKSTEVTLQLPAAQAR